MKPNITCDDCIHYKLCLEWHIGRSTGSKRICPEFDWKTSYIKLPCKIGSKVYFPLTHSSRHISDFKLLKMNAVNVGEVIYFFADKNDIHIRVQFKENGCTEMTFFNDELNQTVFFSKTRAEEILEEELDNDTRRRLSSRL